MNFDASNVETACVQCAVCEKTITGGKWYSRIKHSEWMVALCCPLCTEVFQKNPDAYLRRIQTLEMLHDPNGIFKDGTPTLPPLAS